MKAMYIAVDMEKSMFKDFRDLFFPRKCTVCGRLLLAEEEHICGPCRADLPLTRFWVQVGNPAEERIWQRAGIVAAASLYFYRYAGGYANLVRAVKYGGNAKLGRALGHRLGEELRSCGRFDGVQAIVPVPLHPLRRLRRGYNQAEIIALGLAEGLWPDDGGKARRRLIIHLLHRRRNTRTQTRLDSEQKAANLKNAFSQDNRIAARLKGEGISHILLVDDVLTSGATISAAALPLMEHFLISVATVGFVE